MRHKRTSTVETYRAAGNRQVEKNDSLRGRRLADESEAAMQPKKSRAKSKDKMPEDPSPSATSLGFESQLQRCRDGAEVVRASEMLDEDTLIKTLVEVMKLKQLTELNREAKLKLRRAFEDVGISPARNFESGFKPLVKLVFTKKSGRFALKHYAEALWLAEQVEIKPEELAVFFRENGGVTRCAALAANRRKEQVDDAGTADTVRQRLEERRKDAPVLRIRKQIDLPRNQLHALFVERGQDGKYRLFGYHQISDAEALFVLGP